MSFEDVLEQVKNEIHNLSTGQAKDLLLELIKPSLDFMQSRINGENNDDYINVDFWAAFENAGIYPELWKCRLCQSSFAKFSLLRAHDQDVHRRRP